MAKKKIPWSGWYWWDGGDFPPPLAAPNGPMDKFDQYIQLKNGQNVGSKQWEATHHYYPGCSWCGHCHGWAAASILEDEPVRDMYCLGIDFGVSDQKGLLTEAHCTDTLDLVKGTRSYTAGVQDTLKVLDFHNVLLDWVSKGKPVVMDMEAESSVWNHPVYKCQFAKTPDLGDPTITHVSCTLKYASDGVDADYIGTKELQSTCHYWIKGSFNNPTAGDWEPHPGKRPGFIWHPDYVNPGNPNANPLVKHMDDIYECIGVALDFIIVLPLFYVIHIGPIIPDYPPDGYINPLIFRGLVARNAVTGLAVPAIALNWESSREGLEHTFHLREGITFHDGSPLTAADVVFSYRAMLNPEMRSTHSEILRKIIAELESPNPRTVTFHLNRPLPNFASLHGWHWIFPEHVIRKIGWERFSANPIGAGPFMFESGEEKHYAKLTAYSGFYLGSPRLKGILALEVPDANRRLELVREGRADAAIFTYDPQLKTILEKEHSLKIYALPREAPTRLEAHSLRVIGRVPNLYDGAWNATRWELNEHIDEPAFASPAGPYLRAITNRVPRPPVFNPDAELPDWQVGAWWLLQFRQRNIAEMTPDISWTSWTQIVFEVIDEELADDAKYYRLRATYPNRPRNAEYKFANIWVRVEDRVPVKGSLHFGDLDIPMRSDFVMELLQKTPLTVDHAGEAIVEIDPRWPDRRFKLPAFVTRTEDSSRVSSLAAPFPLRITTPNYEVELVDWDV